MTKTEQLIETIQDLSEEQLEQLLNVAIRMRETAVYYSLPEHLKAEIDQAIIEDDDDNDTVTLSEYMTGLNAKLSPSSS